METPKCPECSSPLDIIADGVIAETFLTGFMVKGKALPVRERKAAFAACTGCCFCLEIVA